MENAVKALYMIAALLIAVMILGLFIYLFRTGSLFGTNYELKKQQEQIDQFNSKFEVYVKPVEEAGGIYFSGNTIFDVITVANLAYDVNERNYNDNRNRVEIEVLGLKDDLSIGIVLDAEEKNILRKNAFFKARLNSLSASTEMIDMNDLLIDPTMVRNNIDSSKKITDAKLNLNNTDIPKNRTIYRYYFECVDDAITYSEITGKVNKMVFTLQENSNDRFEALGTDT